MTDMIADYFKQSLYTDGELEMAGFSEPDFIEQTVVGTVTRADEIDSTISQNAQGWELSRLMKTDLAILRLAVYEILHNPDVPSKVSVNEAVELSKVYSGGDSPGFVNGLLGQIIRKA